MMKGTHGTCVSRANAIKISGFKKSENGLRGSGTYFWGYTRDALQDYVRNLAISWWRFAHTKKHSYKDDQNPRCCVVYATLEAGEDDILDFENQAIRDRFFEFALKTKPRLTGEESDITSRLYDMFINEAEDKLEKEFRIIHVKVQQPANTPKHLSLDITGQPSCYVVKDLSCITTIDKFEEVNDE
ncbi:hypothetical protein [Aeromonas veronii]